MYFIYGQFDLQETANIEFTLYELKCTIHAILQHMGFYHTT